MEQGTTLSFRLNMVAIGLLLGLIALFYLFGPGEKVHAEATRFDHVQIVSTAFIHKGQIGLLLLDRRNGNVWFAQKSGEESKQIPFEDPVFLFRAPFEKLDQAPQEHYPQR